MRSVLMTLLLLLASLAGGPARADSAEQIRQGAGDALGFLRENIRGAGELLDSAAGVLVFPDVVKLGFGVGGEYGEGVLLVAGQPVGFYATSGASFGLPPGSRIKSEVVVFVSEVALQAFHPFFYSPLLNFLPSPFSLFLCALLLMPLLVLSVFCLFIASSFSSRPFILLYFIIISVFTSLFIYPSFSFSFITFSPFLYFFDFFIFSSFILYLFYFRLYILVFTFFVIFPDFIFLF